ncbi:MAG: PorV/PorQ family protein [Bacteroidales bacterium]|nr:PorV/PorQ family protein [Bacteroidales bacterium]MBQ7490799.1 PorV/PorQ family protein [Bacteroidales bacterium]
MKITVKTLIVCTLVGVYCLASTCVLAGNRDRSGQAGAQHLLIDPWAKTNGWGNAGVAEIRGLESIYSNVAGMSFVNKTEFGFSHTRYLCGSGAGISINSFALAQALYKKNKETGLKEKDYGVLGLSFFSMGFGNIQRTSTTQPEGNMGSFSPNLMYIGLSYAKSFNSFIHGGATVKLVTETGADDCKATGFALDVGIQYQAGAYNNFKIGVTMKNIGFPISYKGDGLSVRGVVNTTDHELTLEQRSAESEMPALLTLGLSYDFLIWGGEYKDMSKEDRKFEGLTRDDATHRITLAASFTANSYSRDVFALGIEYGFMRYFMVRAGYAIEAGMWNTATSTTWYSGPSAGVSAGIPLVKKSKGNSRMVIDYAYRFTNRWKGNHCVGIKIEL